MWRIVVLAPLLLGGCQSALLNPGGPVGLANRTILIDSLAIMLSIVLPTIAATLGFAWWYRESNTRAKYLPTFEYSGRLEMIVWSIPMLTIILLGGVAWIGSRALDPAVPLVSDKPVLQVQVVSLDWKWLFIYPDQHVASVNELVVPAGVPVHFALTSASVLSTFFIPRLGSMIYTMNGMATQLNLQADAPGSFHGLSGHYNGDGFSDMHFEVRAVTPAKFADWVSTTRGSGGTLDGGSYTQLAKQSIADRPLTYHDVTEGLFQQILSQELPPGPGPANAKSDLAVHPKTEH